MKIAVVTVNLNSDNLQKFVDSVNKHLEEKHIDNIKYLQSSAGAGASYTKRIISQLTAIIEYK